MLRRASVVAFFLVLMPATVEAFDHHHHHHHSGSTGDGCGSSSTSSPEAEPSAEAPPASSSHARVFVTSTMYSGALGGLAAADAQCQSAATAHGLSGIFRAWISDKSGDARIRVADAGPWYTTNDELAFATKDDLSRAPNVDLLDELGGHPASAAGAWSGSDAAGAATGVDCDGWTNATLGAEATTGSALGLDPSWGGDNAPLGCDAKAPLICFQQ